MQINKHKTTHKQNKGQKHITISIDGEKAFNKIQCPFIIKALKKLEMEGTFLNLIKAICEKPKANIIQNGEKMKPFLIKSQVM
jgi:hypothetical protein